MDPSTIGASGPLSPALGAGEAEEAADVKLLLAEEGLRAMDEEERERMALTELGTTHRIPHCCLEASIKNWWRER